MLRVLAFTGGHNNPSGVHRIGRYASLLRGLDVDLVEVSSKSGKYPPERKVLRPAWGLRNLSEHLRGVLLSRRFDATLFQREMLSTFVTLEPFTKRPRILDVDDAIWAHDRGGYAKRLAALCDHVICGNRFLAEEFSRWNSNVSVLPTPVDITRFRPAPLNSASDRLTIGWQGLFTGFRYLYQIETALAEVLRKHPEAILRIVSDRPPAFTSIAPDRVEFVPFSWEREAVDIQEMDVGIMPIDDSVVSRGKCSFKMLLYMASGLPVVVSPYGMNAEVLEKGEVGFGARNQEEWIECLDFILRDAEERRRLGKNGREVVEKHYAISVLATQLAETLHFVAGWRCITTG